MFVPDFGNNTVALFDAYADTHPFPWLRLRVGKFKGPVGLERLQSDHGPRLRRTGAHLRTCRPSARWASSCGATSPAGSSATRPATSTATRTTGTTTSTATSQDVRGATPPPAVQHPFAARLRAGWRPASPPAPAIEQGTASNTWVGAFKSFGQNTIFSYLATTTPTRCSPRDDHTRVNPQLYYYIGPFGLLAEWVHEYQQLANAVGSGAGEQLGRQRRWRRSSSAATRPMKASGRTKTLDLGQRGLRRAGDRRALQLARRRSVRVPERGQSERVGQPGARRRRGAQLAAEPQPQGWPAITSRPGSQGGAKGATAPPRRSGSRASRWRSNIGIRDRRHACN